MYVSENHAWRVAKAFVWIRVVWTNYGKQWIIGTGISVGELMLTYERTYFERWQHWGKTEYSWRSVDIYSNLQLTKD